MPSSFPGRMNRSPSLSSVAAASLLALVAAGQFVAAPHVRAELAGFPEKAAAPAQPAPVAPPPAQAPAAAPPKPVIVDASKAQQRAQNRTKPKRARDKNEAKMDAEQARELYRRRQRRLQEIATEQKSLTRDTRLLASDRARMQDRLIETARSIRVAERRLIDIEDRLKKARVDVAERRKTLIARSAEMSELFALMQRMSRNPPPVMITRSGDAFKMIRSGMVLANFYTDVEKLAAQVSSEVTRLDSAVQEAEAQEQKHRIEQAEYGRLKSQIDLLLIENQEQLKENKERMEALKSAAKLHTAALKDLKDIVPKLDQEVAQRSELGAYERDLRAAQLTPDAQKVSLVQPGRMKPSIPFAQAKGLCPLPAEGKILVKFGEEADGVESSGLQIRTRPGAQVTSPTDGWIVYAGEFRAYGQLLIINAGGGYHILLAGMERIQAEVGQFVLAGEPVASMGGMLQARAKDTPVKDPTLYVEFRRDQQPIDPAPWWSAGGGKG